MREMFIDPRRTLLLGLILGIGSLTVGDSVYIPGHPVAAHVKYDFEPMPGVQAENSAGIAVKLTASEPLTVEQAEALAAENIERFSGSMTLAQGFQIQGQILDVHCESIVDPGLEAGGKPYTSTSFITDCVVEFGNTTSL